MRYWLLVLFPFLILFSCKQVHQKQAGSVVTSNVTTAQNADGINVYTLRKRLYTFFETHKSQDVFDTTDYTYEASWGPMNFPPYAVRAGHLFNTSQVHAMIFYSDNNGAGLTLYVKNKGAWQKIFEDTAIDGQPGSAFPMLTDWNRDGINDVTIRHSPPAGGTNYYDLWLMDKHGDQLHAVDSFSEIHDPEIENVANHVISYVTCGCADNCMVFGEYVFNDYKLQQLYELNVSCCGNSTKKGSECSIIFTRKNKEEAPIYTSTKSVYKYMPKTWQGMIREKYNSEK